MILDDNSTFLQALMSSNASTRSPHVVVSFSDTNTANNTYLLSGTALFLSGTNKITIIDGPSSGSIRKVNYISIFNADTVQQTITIQLNKGAVEYPIYITSVTPSGTIMYTPASSWNYINNSGSLQKFATTSGRYLQTVALTGSGITSSYTTSTGTLSIKLRMVGPGGGGGGAATATGSGAVGAGGGSGGYLEAYLPVSASTSYTYTLGLPGAGGSSAGGDGGDAQTSTFSVGNSLYKVYGGFGGKGMAATSVVLMSSGGLGGLISESGSINTAGNVGFSGVFNNSGSAISGMGASTVYGGGGASIFTQGAGVTGSGFGAGGGGAACINNGGGVAGGSGSAGIIIIEEYS